MGKLSILSLIGLAVALLSCGTARAQSDGLTGGPPPPRMATNTKLQGIPEPFRDMVDHSPTLQGQLKTLQDQGWKVEARSSGGAGVSFQTKTIDVGSYSPIQLADAATRALEPYGRPTVSLQKDPAEFQKQFDQDLKLNGASAVLNAYVVRSEVLERGGKDPGKLIGSNSGGPSEMAQEQRDLDARLESIAADRALGKDAKVQAVADTLAKQVSAQDIQPKASISVKSFEAGRTTNESFVVRSDGTEEFSSSGSSDHAPGVFDHVPDAPEKARATKAIGELASLPEPTAADRTIAPGQPAVTLTYPDAQGREHAVTVNMDYVTRNRDKIGDFSKLGEVVARKLDPPAKTGGFGTSLDRVGGQR